MKTVSRKKKLSTLDAVLAVIETDMAQLVAGIVAERRTAHPAPRRRARAHPPKGHAHAA